MTTVTLSSKNQIVLPRKAREALGLKPGDLLDVVVRGERIIVLQRPQLQHVALRGLGRARYPAGHVERERKSWD